MISPKTSDNTFVNYSYLKPFIYPKTSSFDFDYNLSEEYKQDIEKINNIVIQFALRKSLIKLVDNRFIIDLTDNAPNHVRIMNDRNLKTVVEEKNLAQIIKGLSAASGESFLTEVIQLNMRLGVHFEHDLLNHLVNRTIISVDNIPYVPETPLNDEEKEQLLTWKFIHRNYPWFWLLIYLQSLVFLECSFS